MLNPITILLVVTLIIGDVCALIYVSSSAYGSAKPTGNTTNSKYLEIVDHSYTTFYDSKWHGTQ
jgi:hypothetical protein